MKYIDKLMSNHPLLGSALLTFIMFALMVIAVVIEKAYPMSQWFNN